MTLSVDRLLSVCYGACHENHRGMLQLTDFQVRELELTRQKATLFTPRCSTM